MKRIFRVDQTTEGVRVVASRDYNALLPQQDIVHPQGCFERFADVYRFFGDHYRETAVGVPLELVGLVPQEEKLLKTQWLGAERRGTLPKPINACDEVSPRHSYRAPRTLFQLLEL